MQAMTEAAHWISSDQALARLCAEARVAGRVALDTEFERTDTYYPRLALVQLCIDGQITLLDPLAITDPEPFAALLADAGVQKVLHSCSEDAEVLQGWTGGRLCNLFDTQLAAAFCGSRYGIGYRDLVAEVFGIELDKDETRSNWLQRPLSPAQERYAALDVALLLPLAEQQEQRLAAQGRLPWLREECERLLAEVMERPGPEQAWRNIKRAGSLDRRGLAALMRLAAWREQRARTSDRPRGWILKDEQLLQLASARPAKLQELDPKALPAAVLRRWGDELQDLLDEVQELSEAELPAAPAPPISRADGERLKRLRKLAQKRARELGIAEELLARRRLLEPLFLADAGADVSADASADAGDVDVGGAADPYPEALRGWRWALLGDELEALFGTAGEGERT